jgi:uncharacterized membrane protein
LPRLPIAFSLRRFLAQLLVHHGLRVISLADIERALPASFSEMEVPIRAAVVLLPQVRDGSLASAPLVALNALGVVAAWAVLNTAYALYYAYIYYGDEEGSGGLEFPGDGEPGKLDFAYFSFAVGTSFATSDVKVTSKTGRRVVLGHAILSFAYNTVLIAVVINVITDL